MFENDKYRELFVQEASEHVDNLNQNLLKYEEEPNSKDLVDTLFRSAHSLKGMAATMEYDQIRDICKAMEEIFDRFRQNEEKITTESSNVLFYGLDLLRQLINDNNKVIDIKEFFDCVKNPDLLETESTQKTTSKIKSTTVKVRMEDLDTMMNLVGELMITKMRLEQISFSHITAETQEIIVTLSRLIAELQHKMMIIRLVPVEQIFDRFSKMIRDISISLNKNIKLEMNGGGIEVDRTVLDAITDPLLHLLRNAADHGIETPDKRKKLGKPEFGTLKLSIIRKSDKVEITVADDGQGIDIESIKIKSVAKNIVTRERLEMMSDEEIIGLLGTPGLSTADTVTDISGRGVGMDVVLTQVKSFGGQVKILTESGNGTQIILSMPLSLSIMGGLVVNIGDQKFILPLMSLVTTLTINVSEIENIHGKEVIKNGFEIIPILRLSHILGIDSIYDVTENEQIILVIVEKDGKKYGLVVDSLEQEREIVVKRLDTHFDALQTFSDATILPDGKVALILDPSMLI